VLVTVALVEVGQLQLPAHRSSVVAKLARGRAAKTSRLRWRQLELLPDRALRQREQIVV
jgi:hypothetical protein